MKTRSKTKSLAIWTGLWTLSIALVTFGSKFIWDENTAISAIAILFSTIIGLGMIRANIKYLMSIDELQRKIMLDAMGIALGTALVGGLSLAMLDSTNVISFDADISYLVILISLTYLGAVIIGNARYR
ncbi:hypothetical protein [Gramella sp. AN32]|uniref:Uncharacterized protein n=1 Tax=Christiangramia antarctica TaxID=2058158 RepID=A0ABW5X9X8_9FLAO|nr:hypothetical protein [Gramella sp. AN32]MCM4156458.1 hypothetical protein [Gramella sp. AN32]